MLIKPKMLLTIIFSIFISLLISQSNQNQTCEVIKLSYIKSDQLLGLLKSMGYNVIEFESIESENFSDMQFIPNSTTSNGLSIIKFPNSEIGYLSDQQTNVSDDEYEENEFETYLGSNSFPHLTSGDPLQRILVCYDQQSQTEYIKIVEYIKNEIDIGAQQIMIDALVIEINSNDLNELNLNLLNVDEIDDDLTNENTNFINQLNNLSLTYGQTGLYTEVGKTIDEVIDLQIQALLKNTSAEILSKPSVLVLDGRQARIQVGEQIPISKLPISNSEDNFLVPDIEYLPTGITLNLRPRISEDKKNVTMQIETIITEALNDGSSSVLSAPIISNRKVESFVRIANNTPFIVGGLISNKVSDGQARIPILHRIPLIGSLFKSNTKNEEKREVIVVITPHIIEDNYQLFSKVIPQDSDFFNSNGNKLFANSYRLEEADIYDLDFIFDNTIIAKLKNNVAQSVDITKLSQRILDGYIPGEEIIVQRMMYDIIKKSNYYSHINPDNIIFFDDNNVIQRLSDLDKLFLKNDKDEGVLLKIAQQESEDKDKIKFNRPVVTVNNIKLSRSYIHTLREENKTQPSIILTNQKHRRTLIEALILRYLLEINENLEISLSSFKRGVEIQFPNSEILEGNIQLLDSDIMTYYYQINDYYNAFETEFNRVYSSYK